MSGAARTVRVGAGGGYPVWIGRGLCGEAAARLASLEPPLEPGPWALVTDRPVARLHGGALLAGLRGWPAPARTVLLPEGERAKTWEVAGEALRALAAAGLDRAARVVCLGGGSVGDAGGFVAATYLRGIAFANVPTTLLAAVDASIGGKTGLNLPEGKNLAGAFHQPRAVVVDLDLLDTLPERGWRDGWAETIKIAITSDPALLELLESGAPLRDADALEEAVARACGAKAAIVSADERETGPRAVLNFGHTVGHAIEAAAGFGRRSHGEAVALGISCELDLGVRLGVTPSEVAERGRRLLRLYGLPTGGSALGPQALAPFLARDKKNREGAVGVVLTVEIGAPILRRLSPDHPELDAAIRAIA